MLLLFDIDGTLLLKASAAHRDAMHDALRRVHGLADPGAPRVEAAGRTDGEIARQILLGSGVPAERIDARADDVRIATCEAYARLCPADLSAHVPAGIGELVSDLAARDDVRLALLTGNFEPVARIKLRAAGLDRFFPARQGGFGSDHEDRTELPAIARARAGSANGGVGPWPRERTAVVGDTPRDIACARADGVQAIAIATGPYGPSELRDADHVARDSAELRGVLDALIAARNHRTSRAERYRG